MALVTYISIINIDFVSKQSKPIDGYSVLILENRFCCLCAINVVECFDHARTGIKGAAMLVHALLVLLN